MTFVAGRFFYGEKMFTSIGLFGRRKNSVFRKIQLTKRIVKKLGKISVGLALATGVLLGGVAVAVDINSASQESLESVKGIGSAKAKLIIEERNKNGAYKSPEDLSNRVRGVGDKTVSKMREQGLTFDSDTQSRGAKGSRQKNVSKSTESGQQEGSSKGGRSKSSPE